VLLFRDFHESFLSKLSVIDIPADARKVIVTLTSLLSVARAAMGLETDISKLYARGFRPAILVASAFLFIASFSPLLIRPMLDRCCGLRLA
jgi:uncharacterized membrane protein YadS